MTLQTATISGRPDALLPLTGSERIPMDQSGATVPAGSFAVGQVYKIVSVGSTDFTTIGAASNLLGVIFRATGAGSGSGSAAIMTTVDATAADIAALANQGGAGAAFVFTQQAPASVWTINHNLGYRPSVELLNAGSQEIEGEVIHPTVNQTVATFSPATAGLARLI